MLCCFVFFFSSFLLLLQQLWGEKSVAKIQITRIQQGQRSTGIIFLGVAVYWLTYYMYIFIHKNL
jgi:hypothetical protein